MIRSLSLLALLLVGSAQAADLGSPVPCPCADNCACAVGQCPACPAQMPTSPVSFTAGGPIRECGPDGCRLVNRSIGTTVPAPAVVAGNPAAVESGPEARRQPIRRVLHRITHPFGGRLGVRFGGGCCR